MSYFDKLLANVRGPDELHKLLMSGEADLDLLLLDVSPLSGAKPDNQIAYFDDGSADRDDRNDHDNLKAEEVDTDLLRLEMAPLSHHGHSDHTGPDNFADSSANLFVGDDRNNTIHGTEQRDVIYGRGGDDTLYGHEGDDTIFGERGNDTIYGGTGNDKLSGGPGDDYLYAGDDGYLNILNGGRGVDRMYGSEYVNVIDIFQFTQDKDTPFSYNPDLIDFVLDFRDGEDLVHLVFDANPFQPGHQEFEIVDEDDAGAAGTIYLDKTNASSGGPSGPSINLTMHGHTDNDGVPDFSIGMRVLVDGDAIDVFDEAAAYQAITTDDFIFG